MINLDEFDLHLWFYMFLGMLALVREVQMLIAEVPPGEEIGAESRSMEEGASDADDVPSPLAEDNEEAMTVIVTPRNSTEDVLKKNRNSDEYASGTKESKPETELDMQTRRTSRTSKTMSLSCRSKESDAPYCNNYQWDATAIDKIIRQLNRYICVQHPEYEKELFPNDTIIRDVIATLLLSDDYSSEDMVKRTQQGYRKFQKGAKTDNTSGHHPMLQDNASRATLKAVLDFILKRVLSLPDPNHITSAAGRSETAEIGDRTNDLDQQRLFTAVLWRHGSDSIEDNPKYTFQALNRSSRTADGIQDEVEDRGRVALADSQPLNKKQPTYGRG